RILGLPRSMLTTDWVRFRLSAVRNNVRAPPLRKEASCACHFGLSLLASFGSFTFTTFINGSLRLTIPIEPGPMPVGATSASPSFAVQEFGRCPWGFAPSRYQQSAPG